MECKDCKYLRELNQGIIFNVCNITNMCNVKSCIIESDEDIEHMDICYNCKHWYGGGDFGLSCAKNYYDCGINGFRKACEQFNRKNVV